MSATARTSALTAAAATRPHNPAGTAPAGIAPGGTTFVHTALGGFILGYEIDRNGTEGILCEALTLPDGYHDVAVETFDQVTGNIIKIVRKLNHTTHDFVSLGVVGNGVGLVEFEQVTTIFVDHRRYLQLNPLSSNMFTGTWTPPLTVNDIITSVSASQGLPLTAFLGFHNGGSSHSFLMASNVASNTFGPVITLSDPAFDPNNAPVMALDRATNQAILAASNGCPLCTPVFASVDLSTGSVSPFPGIGFGFVNGIAVDSATRTACTSTEIDFRVEFYDLSTHTGFSVPIPGAVSQAQSGQDVQLDPIHGLFLVGQEFSSTAASGSSIQVFDEHGNFVESINGLSLPASPARIALNPTTRTGYVLVAPDLTSLQWFNY